jgi:uncharacterized protein (DUF983 family)
MKAREGLLLFGGTEMPLIDFYGDFCRSVHSCGCGWSGPGADMVSGESFGDGVEKHCPRCGDKYGFVQWSVVVAENAAPGWEARIERAAD